MLCFVLIFVCVDCYVCENLIGVSCKTTSASLLFGASFRVLASVFSLSFCLLFEYKFINMNFMLVNGLFFLVYSVFLLIIIFFASFRWYFSVGFNFFKIK